MNEDRLSKYAAIVEKWNTYKDGKGECPKTVTDRLYTRRPPAPKTESLLLQCHSCHQMMCSRKEGSHHGSTCLNADSEQYDWSDGMCTCGICSCPCKKGYAMHNITKIGIELTRSKMTGDGSAAGK